VLLSLSTACLYGFPLRTTFALAAEAGFEAVELVMGPQVWCRGTRHAASLAQDSGLEIHSVHPTPLGLSPDGRGVGCIRDAVRAGLELGCSCVVVHVPEVSCWTDPVAQRWLKALEDCQRLARGSAMRITLENSGVRYQPGREAVLGRLPALVIFAREHGLGITFDACHAGAAGLELLPAYDLVRDRLVNVHFSDFRHLRRGTGLGLLSILLAQHRMPGEGCLPLADLATRLAQDGFSGSITVEVGAIALRAWSRGQLRRRLSHIVEYIRSALSQPYGRQ